MALKTDYKDDILDTSVNTKRKYRQIDNEDGTFSLEDETEYTQEGDSFGATDINKTNEAVNKLTNFLTGTLTAGETSLTISDSSITEDSIIDIYTNVFGVNPTEVTVVNGSITLVFDAQETDLGVKVRVM
mgnify:CR=1 FL=1